METTIIKDGRQQILINNGLLTVYVDGDKWDITSDFLNKALKMYADHCISKNGGTSKTVNLDYILDF